MQKNKTILLDQNQRQEIENLKTELENHIKEYGCFKNFIKRSKDALKIADALLNNDYKEFKKHQLSYTTHTAEKMRGINSLSTYKKVSEICRFLSLHDGICKKCYAEKSIKLYKAALLPQLIYNTLLLKYIDIDAQQIPYTNNKYFRFESFSDLQGSKHFKNLIAICNKNKNTIFTLWTKAGYTLKKYMDTENIKKLPSNLNIIISEFYINKKTDENYIKQLQAVLYPSAAITGKYNNALKVFIVYDDPEKQRASGLYLCNNSCVSCLKCYKKSKNIIYIAEKIH